MPFVENTHAAPPKLAELFRLSGGKEDLTQYNRVPLCGGKPKCFFMASAVGKIMQQQSQVPTAERMQVFSNGNKANHLAWVKKKISENACFPEDGPPLSLSLQCATGLLQNEYLEELEKGNLLGGWLEASIMASRVLVRKIRDVWWQWQKTTHQSALDRGSLRVVAPTSP